MKNKFDSLWFDRHYVGPRGAHLSHRTYTTIHGKAPGPKFVHHSIHNRPVFVA
jgi:hypothetical protein